mmetsp:Transcript_12471/g.20706  ORF Transcript_12471/g.20706 Transcript_12471/m.20706 type:complete len:183 (-) Transcript_12471:48-596(-)
MSTLWIFIYVILALCAASSNSSCSVQAFFVGPQKSPRPPSQLFDIQSSLVSVRQVPEDKEKSDSQTKKILYHVDFKNFWQKTRGHFVPCDRPPGGRSPDFKSKHSWYWDVDDEYVVRSSNHWSNACGNIKDCYWTFDEAAFRENSETKKTWLTGRCNYADLERGKKSSMRVRLNDRKVLKKK